MEMIIMGVFMIASFLLGYFLRPKPSVTTPVVKPKKIKKREEPQEEISDSIRIMLENIDNYNGTAEGQQDVPEDEEEW